MIAALYVDTAKGPYPSLGVDCWGVERDARTYAGPGSVVAHPPCAPWGKLRWSHERAQARGSACPDGLRDCAPIAVEQVRRWGGVLEHPAESSLWRACYLPRPGELTDGWGITIEVNQCDWGHPAEKRTWLYIVGCSLANLPARPPRREPTHSMGVTREVRVRPELPKRLRHLTPLAFARWLVEVARRCAGVRQLSLFSEAS